MEDYTHYGTFPTAFKKARWDKQSKFLWRGNIYTTKLANEVSSSRPKKLGNDAAMGRSDRPTTRLVYDQGPLGYLVSSVVKEMDRAGYPVDIHTIYRSPDEQARLKAAGFSKADPFDGAHQYYCAGDLIHEKWAWFAKRKANGKPTGAPDGSEFWNTLWDCVAVVSEKHSVPFEPRLSWDPAHIELDKAIWHQWRAQIGKTVPTTKQLESMFQELLPTVWRQHVKAKAARKG